MIFFFNLILRMYWSEPGEKNWQRKNNSRW